MKYLFTLLLLSLALPAFAADIEQGKAVFDANCRACHSGGAAGLKSKPDKVPALLKKRSIAAHRHIRLSESDTQALVTYLRTQK